jgi:phosphoglycolate phosphatase
MVTPTVIFDLDGTLVDTAPDLVAALNFVVGREGVPPIAYDAARKMVGRGARSMIERGLAAGGRKLAAGELNRLVEDFIAYYAEHIADRSRPFPGLEATLDELAADGYRLAVCTNKLEGLSRRLLDALGLSSRFVAICGADTFGIQKPNPELLRRTIARAAGDTGRAVMVGDSDIDIATARAAGVPVVGVDYGYTEIPVAELAPDRVISALSELPDAVFALLGAGSGTPARSGHG